METNSSSLVMPGDLSAATNRPGTALFISRDRSLVLTDPIETVFASALHEVLPSLDQVQHAVDQCGMIAAGYIAYEAGPAFDAALRAHEPEGDLPLLWFALYERAQECGTLHITTSDYEVGDWNPRVAKDDYLRAVRRIRDYIASGDVYQVNYTFPLEASFRGDTMSWFHRLVGAQRADYAAFLNMGRYHVLSASPELFFLLDGDRLTTKPMKGTRPRGRWLEEDRRMAADLATSEKDRAENVMIVDLVRNDAGRVAAPGSVRVARLFDVERYPTVWQMTSTIEAVTDAPVPRVFEALFPPGSVTGAPKVRMTEIAKDLEPYPRGVYCGTVGWWFPNRRAQFNVAIRTVLVDTSEHRARYGVGGGITWDSSPEAEYEECRVKAGLLTYAYPEFNLLESILFDGGYFLLDEHLARLEASAEYFGIPLDRSAARRVLDAAAEGFERQQRRFKVRLLVSKDGSVRIEAEPAPAIRSVRVGLAKTRVDPSEVFLFHKTTHRKTYQEALDTRPDCDDVILVNSRGEITETTTANLVLDMEGRLLTPRQECGLLPGTFRTRLLSEGVIEEAVLRSDDLRRARAVWLINSVRKWVPAVIAE